VLSGRAELIPTAKYHFVSTRVETSTPRGTQDSITGIFALDRHVAEKIAPNRENICPSQRQATGKSNIRKDCNTHPLGQTLIITAGCGWVQREGGPIEEIRPGDVVWFSSGEKHWHGAARRRRR